MRTPPSTLCVRHDTVAVAENALTCVAMGAGKTLEDPTYCVVLSEHYRGSAANISPARHASR